MREDRSVLDLLQGGLHVPERAAGEALRHPARVRHAVPPRRAGAGQRARRAAAAGEHPDGDVVRDAHVAGDPRQVDPGEPARHAAAAAAAERAGAGGQHGVGVAAGARAAGAAPGRTRLRELPQADGPGRASRWRTSTRSAAGGRPRRASRSTPPAGCPTAASSPAWPGWKQALLKRPEVFVGTLTEKLLTFALGRGVESYDGPAVRQIVRDGAGGGLPLLGADRRRSSTSTPFQMRTSP